MEEVGTTKDANSNIRIVATIIMVIMAVKKMIFIVLSTLFIHIFINKVPELLFYLQQNILDVILEEFVGFIIKPKFKEKMHLFYFF